MSIMILIILREIIVLLVCMLLLPAAVIAVLIQTNSLHAGAAFFAREMLSSGTGLGDLSLTLWLKLFSPYLFVQTIRAYLWSQRSMDGRKWANLFYFALLTGIWALSLWSAGDLFYFMYALGDIPAELMQFIQLEASNLVISIGSFILSLHCLSVFFNPGRNSSRGSNNRYTHS